MFRSFQAVLYRYSSIPEKYSIPVCTSLSQAGCSGTEAFFFIPCSTQVIRPGNVSTLRLPYQKMFLYISCNS
jgi:hypothetical protein